MPGARRGALPLAVFIIALLFAGLAIAISRGGDGDPMADDTPTPTFTVTPMSPTATSPTTSTPTTTTTPPTTTPASPTETPTESPTSPAESPTTTPASPTDSPTTIPPTLTPTLPTPTGAGDMPRTGMPVGGWLVGGLVLMLASTAMMRALSRRPA